MRTLVAIGGPDALVLRTPIQLEPDDMSHAAEFTVREGERVPFVLTWYPSHVDVPRPVDAEQALADTEAFWRDWIAGCRYEGEYGDAVQHVADRAQGAHLPADGRDRRRSDDVAPGADRRRAQLGLPLLLAPRRDLHALRADERRLHRRGAAWRDWLLRAVGGDPAKAQILYGIGGQRRVPE